MVTPASWFSQLRSVRGALFLGLVVGLAFLPFRMTVSYFTGHFPVDPEPVLMDDGRDRTQHLAGALYYARDEWRWPLFQTQNLGWPDGTNVVYTDCVPGAALLLKLANQVHPLVVDYFGFFVALCLVLNPVFFCWLLYELKVREGRFLLAGAILASCVPALLFRHAHAALCGHFLILWALALYFRSRNHGLTGRLFAAFFGVVLLALLDNVYLLAMVWAVYFAAVVQACVDGKLAWKRGVWVFLGTLTACLGVMVLCGYLSLSQGLPPPISGFGHYSMNLLSPFWPWRSAFAILNRNIDDTGGQYEGYNYLGAGMLLLLLVHGVKSRRQLPGLLRRHWALAGAMAVLAICAFSNKICLGNWVLVEYHFPPFDHFMANFRASGRLFWPVNYCLMAALVVLTVRRFTLRTATWLLLSAAGLQAYDMHVSPRLGTTPLPAYAQPGNVAFWEKLFRGYSRIEIQPAYLATVNPAFNVFIQYVTARDNQPINSSDNSRPPTIVAPLYAAADHPSIQPGVLYLFQKSDYSRERLAMILEGQKYDIADSADCFVVASTLPANLVAQSEGKLAVAPAPQFLAVGPQVYLDFQQSADLAGVAYTGFYKPNEDGRRVRGSTVAIWTGLDFPLRGQALVLRAQFQPRLDAAHPREEVAVELNGHSLGTWVFQSTDPAGLAIRSIAIPAEANHSPVLHWRFTLNPADTNGTLGSSPLTFVRLHVTTPATPP